MNYNILSPMGELEVLYLKERPSCFFKADGIMKRVLIMPSDAEDFEALMIDSEARVIIAPRETALAASLYFAMRGIPQGALSVSINRERVSLPNVMLNQDGSALYPVKCKQSYTKSDISLAGIAHKTYTTTGKFRTRILPLPEGSEVSAELVRRLSVSAYAPDAIRSLAFSPADGGYKVELSDRVITLDVILPLLLYLSDGGVSGETRIRLKDRCSRFDIERDALGFTSLRLPVRILPEPELGLSDH